MKKGITLSFLFHFLFFLLSWFITSPQIPAGEISDDTEIHDYSAEAGEDEKELARLIHIIDKYTEIATKTKLNVDFVPGIVTVLKGEDLEVRGVHNLWEALKLVPGMDIGMNGQGLRHVLVRGIGDTIASGNLKFQLNGISMNSALWGKAYPGLDMPVEQIDRIEIIRGPGSAVHGEFASTGVVNVITKEEGTGISGGFGSNSTYMGSALFSINRPEHDFKLNLNMAGFDTKGADIEAGPDRLYGLGMETISNAPGPTDEARDYNSLIIGLSLKNIDFKGYFLNTGNGDHFGFIGSLPPPHNNISFRFKNYGGQLKSGIEISETLFLDFKLGFYRHRFESAVTFEQPPWFSGSYPDGMFAAPFYQENRVDGSLDFSFGKWEGNIIKFGLAFAHTDIDEVWHDKSYIPSTGASALSMHRYAGSENWLLEGRERNLLNLIFQDEIKIVESVTVTAGLRYDHYDDVGSELSPRIGAVWRMAREHILKTQYARAFCPPTFNQLYARNNPYLVGNPAIKPETIDTIELSYIYHSDIFIFRSTGFYSDLDNLISSGSGTYSNTGSTKAYGVEFEIEHQFAGRFKLDSNIAWSHSKNSLTDSEIPGTAELLGDIGLIFEPDRHMAFNIQYGYVGKRNRSVTDIREKLQGYHTADITLSLYDFPAGGLTFRTGIKNILGEDVYYASPEHFYDGDYPRPGREWWMKVAYEF